jgi:hypothetical protein
MRVEDLQSKGSAWLIRLHEKDGKQHMMPCHHALAEALHAYTAAGITAPIGNHSFRATGTTAYLANGGTLEHAQSMARTTKLYDRTKERLTQDEIERIVM